MFQVSNKRSDSSEIRNFRQKYFAAGTQPLPRELSPYHGNSVLTAGTDGTRSLLQKRVFYRGNSVIAPETQSLPRKLSLYRRNSVFAAETRSLPREFGLCRGLGRPCRNSFFLRDRRNLAELSFAAGGGSLDERALYFSGGT